MKCLDLTKKIRITLLASGLETFVLSIATKFCPNSTVVFVLIQIVVSCTTTLFFFV